MARHGGIAVACVSPSRVVPTPGTVYHKLVDGSTIRAASRRR
jgi:hypothetical protein